MTEKRYIVVARRVYDVVDQEAGTAITTYREEEKHLAQEHCDRLEATKPTPANASA